MDMLILWREIVCFSDDSIVLAWFVHLRLMMNEKYEESVVIVLQRNRSDNNQKQIDKTPIIHNDRLSKQT